MPNLDISDPRGLFLLIFFSLFLVFFIYQLFLRLQKTGGRISYHKCLLYLSKKFPDYLEFKKTKLTLKTNNLETEFRALYQYFRYMYDNSKDKDSDKNIVLEEFFSAIEHLLSKGNRKIKKSVINNFLTLLIQDMMNLNISVPFLPKHLGRNTRKHCLKISLAIKPDKKQKTA